MKRWLYAWLVLALAVIVTVAIFPGIHVDWTPGTYLGFAAAFAAVNIGFGPVLRLLTLRTMLLTLGLFGLVINTALFAATAWLFDSFSIDNIGAAFGGSIVIAAVLGVIAFVLRHARKAAHR